MQGARTSSACFNAIVLPLVVHIAIPCDLGRCDAEAPQGKGNNLAHKYKTAITHITVKNKKSKILIIILIQMPN